MSNPTVARILARTAARKEAGLIPDYSGKGKAGAPPARVDPLAPCARRGEPTGESVTCPSCRGGRVELKVFACAVHSSGCTIARKVDGLACCANCPDRTPAPAPADSRAP